MKYVFYGLIILALGFVGFLEQHGLFLQDFGVQDAVGPLQTKTIRFTANRRGESTTFCSATHPEKLIINVI